MHITGNYIYTSLGKSSAGKECFHNVSGEGGWPTKQTQNSKLCPYQRSGKIWYKYKQITQYLLNIIQKFTVLAKSALYPQ